MSKQPKPKILTRLRIDEVSAVDRGAGERCRIVLAKRDSDAPRLNLIDVFTGKLTAAEALGIHVDKSAAGDEAEGLIAEPKHVVDNDGADGGVPKKHSITFDTVDGARMKFPSERALPEWLAIQSRIRKSTSEESNSMSTTPEQKLSDIVKRAGITAVAAQIVKADSAFSIDEHTLTQLTIEHAKREHPQLTDAQAFAKVYSAQDEGGVILRKAFNVVKAAGAAPYFDLKPQFVGGEDALDVDDPSKAIAQLTEIGRQKWPTASEAQQFENAFSDPANAELARKAYRRPAATTVYPFPR